MSSTGLRSIRVRILAAFVLTLGAFSGALGYGLYQLRAIGEGLVAIDAGYLPLAGVANELEAVVRLMDREHDRLARESPRPLVGHRSNVTLYDASLRDALERGRRTAGVASQRITDQEDRFALEAALCVMDDIDEQRTAYVQAFEVWADGEGASGRALAELDSRRTELILKVGLLSDLIEGRIETVSAQTAQAQTRALAISGALATLSIVLAGMMALLALLTLRPIEHLTAQVQRLGAGDYAGRVDVRSGDEVGLLAREFNAMADAVAERDHRLSERAEALDRLSLQLRRVLDTIHSGLVVVEHGDIVMANPAAKRLWGAPLPDELQRLEPGRHEARAVGDQLQDIDVVPFGEGGRLILGEDVTARVRDQQRLARSARLALVGQMLAQITHEVRNPLNALSLNADLLTEDLQDDEQRELMETITREIRRLEQLTARYLDLSRGRDPELSPVDPADVARDVLRLEAPALDRADVRVDVASEGVRVVEIDADALRRALRNIVRNAVEAGAHRVSIGFVFEPDFLQITVGDDGPGLDATQLERVFEPFFTTKTRGTGLGLAITRQELEDVGGTIRCESDPGQGSRFIMRIPIEAEPLA